MGWFWCRKTHLRSFLPGTSHKRTQGNDVAVGITGQVNNTNLWFFFQKRQCSEPREVQLDNKTEQRLLDKWSLVRPPSKSFLSKRNDKPNKIAYYLLDLLPNYDALDSRVAWVGEAGVGQIGMPIRFVNTPSVRLVLGRAVKKGNEKNYIIRLF